MYKRVRTLESLEKELAQMCEDIYLLNMQGKRIQPLPPKIIVRVLPKEHRTSSGLFLPGNVQSKPVYEGIVLQTWKSYDEERTVTKSDSLGNVIVTTTVIHHQCSVNIGDRILFPHFEGQPLSDYLDEKYYRVIKDDVVFGVLNYDGDASIVEEMKKLMQKFSSVTTSGTTDPKAPAWEPPAKSDWFQS